MCTQTEDISSVIELRDAHIWTP